MDKVSVEEYRDRVLCAVGLSDMPEHAKVYGLIHDAGQAGISAQRLIKLSQSLRRRSQRHDIIGDLIDRGVVTTVRKKDRRFRIYRCVVWSASEIEPTERDRVLAVIRSRPDGLTGHQLANRTRFFGADRARRLEVLDALAHGGFITITETRTGAVGRPGRVYRAKAHNRLRPACS